MPIIQDVQHSQRKPAPSPVIPIDYKELASLLIKKFGITHGHWGIYIEFTMAGQNAYFQDQNGRKKMCPTAILGVSKIGLQQFDQPNDLTVDAGFVVQDDKNTGKIRQIMNEFPQRAVRETIKVKGG